METRGHGKEKIEYKAHKKKKFPVMNSPTISKLTLFFLQQDVVLELNWLISAADSLKAKDNLFWELFQGFILTRKPVEELICLTK